MYYSQLGEDKYIYEKYFINYKKPGIFLEMGALNGILYSNTFFFESELQWTGILIEPNPIQFNLLKINRPKCILYNDLISNITTPLEFKYFHHIYAAVSGITDTLPQLHLSTYFNANKNLLQDTIKLQPKTLTEIIKNSNITHIDFFSLDVEGHELNVLQSFDFSIPIYLILVESLSKYDPCKNILENNGFNLVDKIGPNNIYINKNFSI